MSFFPLPHHASLTSVDPLGVCDTDGDQVLHAVLLEKLLSHADADLEVLEGSDSGLEEDAVAWIKRLQTLLQDIAYSLHQDHKLDADGLLEALTPDCLRPLERRREFRKYLFRSARHLAQCFPDAKIPYLSNEQPSIFFAPESMDALLAHLILGTLQIPPGNTWGRPGFSQYCDGKVLPVVRNTAPAYLKTILNYFAEGGYSECLGQLLSFAFTLSTSRGMPEVQTSERLAVNVPIKQVDVPRDPSMRKESIVLVAANAQPGPGAGGTHEERLVGQSPAMAVVSLLTPILQPDQAVITSPLPVHASWQGHGRTAELLAIYPTSERIFRSYIIADALPLDLSHRQADLRPGNMLRETSKLYAAFVGAKRAAEILDRSLVIEMPPWGCGAFGGNLSIKITCMMMAAALAGLQSETLELLVPKDGGFDLASIPKAEMTVGELYASLMP